MTNTDNPREKTFGPRDAVFICLYLAGTAVCLFLFWQDLNLSLTRLDEKPVGVVTYKYRATQRRYAERILWERLKEESPVYDGDTIRTADVSEATISLFADSGIIDLGENTLIRIQVEKTGTVIDITDGDVSAVVQRGGLRIASGDVTIDAAPGTVVTATVPDAAGGEGLEVRVLEGSAGVRKAGEQRTVAAGEVYSAAAATAMAARVAVVSPAFSAKFLNGSDGPLEVAFRWNRIGFAEDEKVRLDIAEDRGFTRVTESRESQSDGETLWLANGVYYWRAYPSSEAGVEIRHGGVNGKLTLVYAPPPALYSPRQGERFRFHTSRPGLRFQWQSSEGAAAYLIEVSSSSGLENPLFSATVQPTGGDTVSIVYSGFPAGVYYWRVTPVYPRDYTGMAQSSAIASFTVEQVDLLAIPQTQERTETVYLEANRQDSYFTWKQEDDAAYYTFLLSRQEDLSNPLIRKQERDNYYVLNAREEGLAPGRYYWGVFQTDMGGNNSAFSQAQTLIVMAGAPPERTAQPESVVQPESAAPSPVPTPEETAPEPPAAPISPAAALPERTPPPEKIAPVSPAAPITSAAAPPEQRVQPESTPRPVSPIPETIPETPMVSTTPAAAVPQPGVLQPLSAPRNLRPAEGYTLTEEIILRDRRIIFSWEQIPGAAGYTFILYQNEGGANREILRRTALRTPSFTLTDLTVLDVGEFVWQVEAESSGAGQRSEAATSRFRVNLDEIETSESRESGVMFGKD
ncbi:MAG: hypothetical protein LBG26_08465 [Treponema sp.]|jgi:hypothetical protein|nr:hypothetical protein [Treponema sp.]